MPPEVQSPVLHFPDGIEQREHYYDPLQPLVGPVENVTPGVKKAKKSKPTAITEEQAAETKRRRRNYDRYIRALIATAGDEVKALSIVYGIESDEVLADLDAYRADVLTGASTLTVGDLAEQFGAGKAARIMMLRKHMYDSDPKVSLVSVKLLSDLDGDKHDRGTSYETYLRMVMGKEA